MVRRLRLRDVPALCAALPPVLLAAASAAMLLLALADRHPFWPRHELNASEAAALRDPATLILLIRRGEDPMAAYPVRAGDLEADDVTVTPLEAAVRARRPEVVEALLWEIGGVDAAAWMQAWCAARRSADREVQRALEAHRPPPLDEGAPVECAPENR